MGHGATAIFIKGHDEAMGDTLGLKELWGAGRGQGQGKGFRGGRGG